MLLKRLALAGLAAGIGLGTAGCTDGYGYSGLSVGYGTAGYGYDGYGYADPYYGGYGYGYPSYFGWYNDFYYPGTGVYVYDQYRRPYRWNNDQQRYWQNRRGTYGGDRGGVRDNWGGFGRRDGQNYRGSQGYGDGRNYRDGQSYRGRQYDRNGQNGGDYRRYRNGTQSGDGTGQSYQRRWSGPAVVPNTFNRNPSGDASGLGGRAPDTGANAAPARQGGWRGGGNGNGGWHGGGGGWRGGGQRGRR